MPPAGAPVGSHRLLDMAVVIRSKDAGINRLTFDIIFTSGENYEAALHSNVFASCNIAKILNLPPERVVGTFFVDSCNAIKISVDRPEHLGIHGRARRVRRPAAGRHRTAEHPDLRRGARQGVVVLTASQGSKYLK